MTMPIDRKTTQRTLLGSILLLVIAALIQTGTLAYGINILSRPRFVGAYFGMIALALLLALLLVAGLLVSTWTQRLAFLPKLLKSAFNILARAGILNLIIFGVAIAAYSYLMIKPYSRNFDPTVLRWSVYLLLVLAGAVLIKAANIGMSWYESLAAALLISAVGYKLATFMPEITIYPFSLGWSETSRYYYASLYLSDQLYGFNIPPSVLHPSRYLMQAAPFLIPDSPLWLHRFWQVLLWITTTLTTSYLLARRLSINERFKRGMFILWISLFLLLAPVYYHLQIIVILILWGFDKRKPWRTLFFVLLASIWAGISRINWFPVPGLLAATLYFLEQPIHTEKDPSRTPVLYLIKPFYWVVVGTAISFGSHAIYTMWSGNPGDQFASSFTSDLLWYRLFPNATYPPGILTGAILVFTPMLLIIMHKFRLMQSLIHPVRIMGTAAILLVLFGGGLVVSVKIGGGSNLHNLDAFLVLFLVLFGYVLFDRVAEENIPDIPKRVRQSIPLTYWILVGICIVIPVVLTINQNAGYLLPDYEVVNRSIDRIQEAIDEAAQDGGTVLFISERQLLIFNTVIGATLIPDYEKVFLMEMAMADNSIYLEKFYEELRGQRFSLIISDPLSIKIKDRTYSFGEENNAWVERVAKPIHCYYEPKKTFKKVHTELLIPKLASDECPIIQK
ncbi:MAG: hypothetical protein U9R58_10885 [Chloroflexota bacterium]|nr:hypothetical protein [Chloroflexota bacterium]